jgi:hypothetical protein
MTLFGLPSAFSHALGSYRTLIRRLGGVALVLMGVHAAADVLDDLAYTALDAIDLVVDDALAALLGWLSAAGGLTPDAAAMAIERASLAVDLAEKDWLALRLALAVELMVDVLLLDLAWGARVFEGTTVLDELRRTTRQLRDAFSAIDLERVLAPLTLLLLAISGSVTVGLALEQPVRAWLAAAAPGLLVASNLAAATGIAVVAVLVWRFVPELLHGAVVRAHERGSKASQRLQQRRQQAPPRHPSVAAVVDVLRRGLRGAWLVAALLIASTGLLGGTHDLNGLGARGLLDRMGADP